MKKLLLYVVVLVLFFTVGCNGDGSDKLSGTNSSSPVEMRKWTNDELKIALYYPKAASLAVKPEDDLLILIEGPGDLQIALTEVEPITEDESDFQTEMSSSFDEMKSLAEDFKEIDRKFYNAGVHPAAYVQYEWLIMGSKVMVMVLDIMSEGHQYQFMSEFLSSYEALYYPIVKAIFDSVETKKGIPDIESLKAGDNEAVKQLKLKFTFDLTKQSCSEENVGVLLGSSLKKGYLIADWSVLREQLGDELPDALEKVIGDEKAAWVSYGGEEFRNGDRHYFIQRFDAGKPDSFGDHDSAGPFYLGSWYGLEFPVLTYKCTWE